MGKERAKALNMRSIKALISGSGISSAEFHKCAMSKMKLSGVVIDSDVVIEECLVPIDFNSYLRKVSPFYLLPSFTWIYKLLVAFILILLFSYFTAGIALPESRWLGMFIIAFLPTVLSILKVGMD